MVGFAPRTVDGPMISEHNKEALREAKRKHPMPKVINGAQLGNVLQGLRNVSNHQAQHASTGGPLPFGLKIADTLKGIDKGSLKTFSKVSVKGKKDFFRARLHKARSTSAFDGSSPSVSLFEILPREEIPMFNANEDRHQGEPSDFQFSAKLQSETDVELQRCGNGFSCGDSSESTVGCGVSQYVGKDGLEMVKVVDENECKDRRGNSVRNTSLARNGSLRMQACDEGSKSRADEGMEDAGWIEFKVGGEANAAF